MTVTCPEGHQSEATDYCDICGTPIAAGSGGAGSTGSGLTGGAGSGTPGPVIPPAADGSVLDLDPSPAPTLTCPHCGAPNVADALFCEACGYDFTTGAAPLGSAPVVPEEGEQDSALDLDLDVDAREEDDTRAEEEGDGSPAEPPAADVSEAEPEVEVATDTDADDGTGTDPDDGADAGPGSEPDDEAATEPDEAVAAADLEVEAGREHEQGQAQAPKTPPAPEPEGARAAEDPPGPSTPAPGRAAVAAHVRPRHTPPSRALSDTWVVEVWVDPDWYAVQQTEEACPSPGLPDIVVVRRNVVLIGRPSGSLGVRPDVDAGADSAVSRRHAQLTSDGSRWWIEDLGSSNGTYVGSVGEPLPTEPIRQRVEIDRDDRIYLGAWTRLVLRQATASEQAGQG